MSISDTYIPPRSIISAMSQIPVARLGPILSQDGATASRAPKYTKTSKIEFLEGEYIENAPHSPYGTPDPPLWAAAMF